MFDRVPPPSLADAELEELIPKHPILHRLRLWRSTDDDDVMARCMCGEAFIGTRLCDVATKWCEHMDEVRKQEESNDDHRP